MAIALPPPQQQVDFAFALDQIRETYLQDALSGVVSSLDIATIDRELAQFAPSQSLAELAGHGLRGELMFAVPCVLTANPKLLGYYRLLLGYSQKAFYSAAGLGRFRSMEEAGALRASHRSEMAPLCTALADASAALLEGIGGKRISRDLLDDLALLTVGPQLRGGYNVRSGTAGIARVFGVVSAIVAHAALSSQPQRIELKNAAGRRVLIQFASDPDIRIQEEMTPGNWRNIIAIEVKAGLDISNIHNRIGEAEKSHQKAKADGYVERWTVINVNRAIIATLQRESPSTDRFYRLSQLDESASEEYQDFYNRVISLTGIVATVAGAH